MVDFALMQHRTGLPERIYPGDSFVDENNQGNLKNKHAKHIPEESPETMTSQSMLFILGTVLRVVAVFALLFALTPASAQPLEPTALEFNLASLVFPLRIWIVLLLVF